MSKKSKLDQYYTKPEVAKWCWEKVMEEVKDASMVFVEPSAGKGVFLREDLTIEAYDIDPKREGIIKMDFLECDQDSLQGKVVVGNPPFGWASSLAVKFINHCKKAEYICFILPKTFKKKLFQESKIDLNLHLIHEWDLPRNSFLLYEEEYEVPCCFQIWKREDFKRDSTEIISFLKKDENGEKFIRRVGGRAGKFVAGEEYTQSSTYRVTCSEETKRKIEKLYPKIKEEASNTAGVRSITIDEINYILTQEYLNARTK